jgi:hypothetical protein
MATPVGDETSRHDPEEPVPPLNSWVQTSAQGHRELLPHEQVLNQERVPASECGAHGADEE